MTYFKIQRGPGTPLPPSDVNGCRDRYDSAAQAIRDSPLDQIHPYSLWCTAPSMTRWLHCVTWRPTRFETKVNSKWTAYRSLLSHCSVPSRKDCSRASVVIRNQLCASERPPKSPQNAPPKSRPDWRTSLNYISATPWKDAPSPSHSRYKRAFFERT